MNMQTSPENDFSLSSQQIVLLCQALSYSSEIYFDDQQRELAEQILKVFETLLHKEKEDRFARWLKKEMESPDGPKET